MSRGYTVAMPETHPISRTLLAVLDNQDRRTGFAFHDLPDDVYRADPGNGCNSIDRIGEHLVRLRQFQLMLLESPLAGEAPSISSAAILEQLIPSLEIGSELVRQAITAHDPDDWYRVPNPPREGKWGEDPTLLRFVRPFNDYTNHLGAVRAIRRILGAGAEMTQ